MKLRIQKPHCTVLLCLELALGRPVLKKCFVHRIHSMGTKQPLSPLRRNRKGLKAFPHTVACTCVQGDSLSRCMLHVLVQNFLRTGQSLAAGCTQLAELYCTRFNTLNLSSFLSLQSLKNFPQCRSVIADLSHLPVARLFLVTCSEVL